MFFINPPLSNGRLSNGHATAVATNVSSPSPNLFACPSSREKLMIRYALTMLAGGSAIVLAAPLSAQTATQPTTPSAASTATAPPSAEDPGAKPSDTKVDAKAKTKDDSASNCGTVIKAGPNQGQVVSKCKKATSDSDTTTAKDGDQPH